MQQHLRRSNRSNTVAIKALILKKLGREKAEMYFKSLAKFLGCKLTKTDLTRLLFSTLGKEILPLHNRLVRSIFFNSSLPHAPIAKRSSTSTISSVNSHFKVREVEVEQVQSRSPLTPPIGVVLRPIPKKIRTLVGDCGPHTCADCSELPDGGALRKRLEWGVGKEGVVGVGDDCVDLVNKGLDEYMKRLIRPCVELARARLQRKKGSCCASLLDFRVAVETNPQLLGEEWPVKVEKICFREYK